MSVDFLVTSLLPLFPLNTLLGSNAVIVAAGGLLSSLLGGVISDYLANPKVQADGTTPKPRARAWVPAIGESGSSVMLDYRALHPLSVSRGPSYLCLFLLFPPQAAF